MSKNSLYFVDEKFFTNPVISFILTYTATQKEVIASIYLLFSIQAFAVHSRAGVYQGISPACISTGSLYFFQKGTEYEQRV